MKRKIKFRIWDKEGSKMINGNDFTFDEYIPINYMFNDSNRFIFMQWTGFTDKNGTEIYEGDILKCKLYNGEYENYVIVWDEEEAGFDALNEDKNNFMLPSIWTVSKIIGNIHENPELFYSDKREKIEQ